MKFLALLLVSVLLVASTHAESKKRKALVIGLDGTRGDVFYHTVMMTSLAPNFRGLVEKGLIAVCRSPYDETCAHAHQGFETGGDFQWNTSAGWSSVISGVNNNKTLVRGNDPDQQILYAETSKRFPSMFKLARDHGLVTAASGTPAFLSNDADGFGIVDYECGADSHPKPRPSLPSDARRSCNLDFRNGLSEAASCDHNTTQWIVQRMKDDSPDLLMAHFNNIDEAGHNNGFADNAPYMIAISKVDKKVGMMLEAIRKSSDRALKHGEKEEWLVIVTGDHGGHVNKNGGGSHDYNWLKDKVVPFALCTYGVEGKSLRPLAHPHQYDINPTVLAWLGVPAAADIDGVVQGI
mmetsp:Transcript_48877/g.122970  ORF Transcript_48877/g.122970 Transcript_48877/m.122970 type:complete len:351 (+) Transcript_48877:214-1266(+)